MVALATFVGGHFILASLPVRQAVIGFIGENGFRLFFSVFALGTLAWTIYAYTQAPYREIWAMTPALRLVPIVLMPFTPKFSSWTPRSAVPGPEASSSRNRLR